MTWQIQFEQITKAYLDRPPLLREASLKIEKGEFLYLTGVSGAGKTTLFRMLMGLEKPDQGEVHFEDHQVQLLPPKALPKHRRQFGMVFQDYKLLENKTTFENIIVPLQIMGMNRQQRDEAVKKVVEKLKIHKLLSQPVRSLSGGEQQLVAIARAAVHSPKVILADEPTANLDYKSSKEIYGILDLLHGEGTTVIFSTHNIQLIKAFEHRTLLIKDNKLVEVH